MCAQRVFDKQSIKELTVLAKELNVTQLAKHFNVSRDAVLRAIKNNKIPCDLYDAYMSRKRFWTKETLTELEVMYESHKYTNDDLADYFKTDIGTINRKIKALGLTSKRCKFVPNEEQINKIRIMALEGKTRTEIATYLKVTRYVLPKLFEEYKIALKPTAINRMGKKFEWTEEKIKKLKELYQSDQFNLIDIADIFSCSVGLITRKAAEMGFIKKRAIFLTDNEKHYYMENYMKKSIEEIMHERNTSEYQVKMILYILNLSDEKPIHPKRQMPNTVEFLEDYINPLLSHAEVARRHGMHATSVRKWRNKDFGEEFRQVYRPYFKTSIEHQVEEMLKDLDFAFIPQYKIGTYKADFYLGHKCIIEVNGDYWHSEDSDKVRYEKLGNSGYMILPVWENQLLNSPDKAKEEIKQFFYKCIAVHCSNAMNNNPVNL